MIVTDRNLDGYPGCTIRVEIDLQGTPFVVIEDSLGSQLWEPGDKSTAMDMYWHPFAYGYVAPESNSEVEVVA